MMNKSVLFTNGSLTEACACISCWGHLFQPFNTEIDIEEGEETDDEMEEVEYCRLIKQRKFWEYKVIGEAVHIRCGILKAGGEERNTKERCVTLGSRRSQ